MPNNIVLRSFSASFETREDGDNGIITGRPVVLNSRTNLGDWDEVIDGNALAKTDLTDVRLCLNHDTSYVYARSRRNNGNSTMTLGVDERGLTFDARLNIKGSPKAQDYYSAVTRGDMDKMSFMFTIDGYEWEDLESEHPTRRITSIGKIFEISCVTFPAYNDTSIEARSDDTLESVKRELESLRQQRAEALENAHKSTLGLALARYKYNSIKNGG